MITFPKDKIVVRPVEDFLLGDRLARMHGREIRPVDVFRVLNAAKLKAVLVGAHAINARSGDPRTTIDVDLVAARPKPVADALKAAFPQLSVEDHPVVIRFKDQKHEAIDVIKPSSSPLFKRALKQTETLRVEGIEILIPDAETTIALKFASMVGPARQLPDRYTDARDFILVVRNSKKLNDAKIEELGELAYAGGGSEILKLLADARAGKRLEF